MREHFIYDSGCDGRPGKGRLELAMMPHSKPYADESVEPGSGELVRGSGPVRLELPYPSFPKDAGGQCLDTVDGMYLTRMVRGQTEAQSSQFRDTCRGNWLPTLRSGFALLSQIAR